MAWSDIDEIHRETETNHSFGGGKGGRRVII